MKVFQLVLVCAAVNIVLALEVRADKLYHTSLNSSYNQFAVYDTGTNSWTQLNPFQTGSTFAVDTSGNMYAYSGNRTAILKYNTSSDTWTHHLNAPTLGGSHPSSSHNFFNLEVTNTGRFLLTGNGLSSLYYSDGGAWSSVPLGFQTNATGDYDPGTGQYAITPYLNTSPKLIDTQTFAVTSFSGVGNGSDWRRSGSILNGHYYSQTSNVDMEEWNLSAPGASPTYITSTPNSLAWMASTVDRTNGHLYAADIVNSGFYRFDGATWTSLAPVISSSGNHTTIAFVSDTAVPEPSSLAALASLGLAGVGLVGWKRRKK